MICYLKFKMYSNSIADISEISPFYVIIDKSELVINSLFYTLLLAGQQGPIKIYLTMRKYYNHDILGNL